MRAQATAKWSVGVEGVGYGAVAKINWVESIYAGPNLLTEKFHGSV